MKRTIMAAVMAGFLFFGASGTMAQTSKPTTTHKRTTQTTTRTTSSSGSTVSSVGSEGNAPPDGKSEAQMQSETAGDPLYLNHPYFNGDARWSHPDSLYKHGDFPYALMQQHPEKFRFNTDSGQWEMLNSSTTGTTNQSR